MADDPDAIAYVLDLGQHVRRKEHRRPRIPSFADELVEDLLMQRIEPAGRLVEDQHRRTVHERDHQKELLFVPVRVLAIPAAKVEVESLGEAGDHCLGHGAPQSRDIGDDL